MLYIGARWYIGMPSASYTADPVSNLGGSAGRGTTKHRGQARQNDNQNKQNVILQILK